MSAIGGPPPALAWATCRHPAQSGGGAGSAAIGLLGDHALTSCAPGENLQRLQMDEFRQAAAPPSPCPTRICRSNPGLERLGKRRRARPASDPYRFRAVEMPGPLRGFGQPGVLVALPFHRVKQRNAERRHEPSLAGGERPSAAEEHSPTTTPVARSDLNRINDARATAEYASPTDRSRERTPGRPRRKGVFAQVRLVLRQIAGQGDLRRPFTILLAHHWTLRRRKKRRRAACRRPAIDANMTRAPRGLVDVDRFGRANVDTSAAIAAGVLIDRRLAIVQLDGVQRAGLDAFAATVAGFLIHNRRHGINTPLQKTVGERCWRGRTRGRQTATELPTAAHLIRSSHSHVSWRPTTEYSFIYRPPASRPYPKTVFPLLPLQRCRFRRPQS